jgi:hypothetical protein
MRCVRALAVTLLIAAGSVPARADYGAPADVGAARAAELHRWHVQCPPVRCRDPKLDIIVVGRFALIDWTAAGSSGQSLLEYAKSKGWYRLVHGGGEMGEGILAALTGDAVAHELWVQYKLYRKGAGGVTSR